MYVKIAFPISSYKIFSYQVPSKLCDQIKIGIRVKAYLNKRKLTGIIVEVSNSNKYSGKTLFIDEIIDELLCNNSSQLPKQIYLKKHCLGSRAGVIGEL